MVSDERALAVRLASTDDDALARTSPSAGSHRPPCGTTSSTPPRACSIRHPSNVRWHASPHGHSSPSPPHSTVRSSIRPRPGFFGRWPSSLRTTTRRRRCRAGAHLRGRPSRRIRRRARRSARRRAAEEDAAAAAEKAFTAVGALADVLLARLNAPLSRTGTGAVSAIDRRRLTDPESTRRRRASTTWSLRPTPPTSSAGRTRVDRHRVRSATARSDHDTALVDRRDRSASALPPGLRALDAALRFCRAGRAPTPCTPSGPTGGAPAPHRRDVGPAHPCRRRTGVDGILRRGQQPGTDQLARTFPPRSIACTCRRT